MLGLYRSEFLKLRSVRSNLMMALAAAGLPVIGTVLVAVFISIENIDGSTIPRMIGSAGNVSMLIIGILGVLCMTQEYSQSTIRLTLAATPNRYSVYLAKLLVVIFTMAILMIGVILVSIATGNAILSARGFTGDTSHPNALAAYAALVAVSVMIGILGVGLGAITRNPPSAIAILLLWPLLVEILVGNIVASVFSRNVLDWLPFGAAIQTTFLEVDALKFGRLGSLGYFGLWVLAIVVIGQFVLRRRDA
jgi:hypothetical protein